MFTMCTQVIDLLLQGFEKEWNTASPKRSFFKYKNLRVLVSFLIFLLWTACLSCKDFYRYDGVWCVFFWNSLRWNNTVTADETWLASLDTKPFIYLITHPAHRRFFTPSRSTSRSPTLRTAKLLLLPPTRIKDLLICGVSKQLAWLSHFTVVAPKKKLSLCLHVYEKAGWTACRILGCLKRDLVKRVTGRTGQTGQCIQLLNRACSPHINRPSVQWRSCETVPTTDFFFILECLTIGCGNKAAYKKKVVI